jgi:putative ABC transport system permease protein
LPRLEDISVEPRVLGYTLLVTLLTAVVFGLAPALHCAKVSVNDALKKEDRHSAGGVQRVRGALVVAEVALSLVLLVGAGLLVKSYQRLMEVDPGFEARNVLTIRLRLPDAKYVEPAQTTGFLKEVMRRVATLASVEQVSVATGFPLGRGSETGYLIEGQPEPRHPGDWHVAIRQSVSENYHRTLGVGLLAGRYFTEHDIADSTQVAIVDEDFVRNHFPDRSIDGVLGERLRFGGEGEAWREVVGVVRHVRHYGLDEEARAEIYRPWLQIGTRWLADSTRTLDLIVKTSTAPENLVGAIKQEVQTLDPEQPLGNVATLDSLLDQSVAPRRFSLMLLGLFAGVALLLAAVGLFGVMSYAVTRRRREIGIRLALGAQNRDVLGMVVKQGLMLSLSGTVVGLAGSFALTRLMTSMLFGVSATDPAIFAAIPVLLVGVALAACYIPARRATKVDPILALRHE